MQNKKWPIIWFLKPLKRVDTFWLLFESKAVRISPPLTISMKEIEAGCDQILSILNSYQPDTVN